MRTKYFERTVDETTVDTDTGEVLNTTTQTSVVFSKTSGEDTFIKLYIQDLGKLNNLQHKTMLVLFELIKTMDYQNEISVSIGKKKDICKVLDIYNSVKGELATNVVDQHITKLVKANLLFRKDKGMYIVNANLFGKGKWTDIKSIRMKIDYNTKERKINTEILKER